MEKVLYLLRIFYLNCDCCLFMFWQALEEAAANAAEEEQRRLQTQTELQDRYRVDLEREKMVRLSSSSSTESCQNKQWGHNLNTLPVFGVVLGV